jgi:hypothetical protein
MIEVKMLLALIQSLFYPPQTIDVDVLCDVLITLAVYAYRGYCCLLVLDSVTSAPQCIRQPAACVPYGRYVPYEAV